MALRNQINFTAKIEGVGVSDIKTKLDYELKGVDDRLDCVRDALEYGDSFYQEYFDEHCNPSLTADDYLLSESNVVKSLESMANYILAKDPEYSNTDDSYFVSQRELDKKANREDEFDGTSESLIEGLERGSNYEEVKNNQNFKKLKRQSIKTSDLKRDDELGSVLRDYNSFLELMSKYTKKSIDKDGNKIQHAEGKKADLYVYTKHYSAVKDDMTICKDSLMKTHGYNLKNFSESTQPDYSIIDLTNKKHLLGDWVQYNESKVKSNGLLSFTATDDYQNDFNCILVDVQNLINKCELTEFEDDVLELYQKGMNYLAISKEVGVYDRKVDRALNIIADKVIVEAKKQIKKN